ELARFERGDDQQDRVGPDGRRLVELIVVDDEVLAQDRQARRLARLAQILERPAEVRTLGQDRQRGGAGALVGTDDLRHGRALADRARRRRAALVLGDHADAGMHERLGERAVLAAHDQLLLERRERDRVAALLHLAAGRVDDLLQRVHATASSLVKATYCSSLASAAPASTAASAARTPCSGLSAPPLT